MADSMNNILFWGVGSIGSLFGGLLKTHSDFNEYNLQFLGRDPHIDILTRKGLQIYSHALDQKRSELKLNIKNLLGFSQLPAKFEEPLDAVFVTCKARDNIACATSLEKLQANGSFTSKTKLIIIQNGVGNEEPFLNFVPKHNIYRVITTEGALVLEPGKIMHSGPGTTLIGKPFHSYGNFTEKLAGWFSDVGLQSQVTNQIMMKTWDKVLINAPINPIATLNHVKNGELLTQPHLRKLVEKVVDETVTILKERNIPFDDVNPLESVINVAKATAENKCSMLQDIEKGRPTEIDYLNGRLIHEASLAGIPAPINNSLTLKIKKLESNLS
jgi:2-dehydropantoate 2-reductase